MFRGCKTEDMPPHVFSLAQTAYRTMLETRRDQSLVFMGRSGSGKTTSFKHALYYLALAAGKLWLARIKRARFKHQFCVHFRIG